jgi:histidinol dehydrogenase
MFYSYSEALSKVLGTRSPSSDEEALVTQRCFVILNRVKTEGDEALRQLTAQHDKVTLDNFKIPTEAMKAAFERSSDEFKEAIDLMIARLYAFHLPQLQTGYELKETGKTLGQTVKPLSKVMVYVPGGTAIYISTLLMNVIPAKIAGVKEIYVSSPPQKDGSLSQALLCALFMLSIDTVYTLGGAQSIGAFAYGTASIPKVDKIVGPGNAYVAAAKKLVFGEVGIDMIAGPSEVLIIADEAANPQWVAADALAQLEHDTMAKAVILSPSREQLGRIQNALDQQSKTLCRTAIVEASLRDNTYLIHTSSLQEAIAFANLYAPEHLGLAVENPEIYLPLIDHAGAVFLGDYTPEAVGDYTAGSNHVLPTLGTARFQSPLGVYDFQKRMSYVHYTKEALTDDLKAIDILTKQEGLDAHGIAATIRFS